MGSKTTALASETGTKDIGCTCRIARIAMEIDGLEDVLGSFKPTFELNMRFRFPLDEPEELRNAVRTIEMYAAKRYDGMVCMGRRLRVTPRE